MSDHKVYDHPPIAMVAVEVRHSGTDPLTPAAYAEVRQRLRKQWPVQLGGQDVTLDFANAGPAPTVIEYQRFLTRDRRAAIVLRPAVTTVETVDYKGWDLLQESLKVALEVRAEISEPAGYERVGLRYINEVRVPADTEEATTIDWGHWVHPSLLSARPETINGLKLSDWQGLSVFRGDDGNALVLRYGPRDGYAVEPNGPLKREATPVGRFFLLDFDSFYETSGTAPEFEPEGLLRKCDDLHTPVRTLFEALITDRLRKEVLDD